MTLHVPFGGTGIRGEGCADQKLVDVNDVLKATLTALTLVGAVLAGLYAYRKQLLSEGGAHRADASQLAERYTTAAEQRGPDQAAGPRRWLSDDAGVGLQVTS